MIERLENQWPGKNFVGKIRVSVFRDEEIRQIDMRIWRTGFDKALIRYLAPDTERGNGLLRNDLGLLQYDKSPERLVKSPQSLISQSWQTSDFTYDDILKVTRLTRDYTHTITSREKRDGIDIVKIECTPLPNALHVWPKIIVVLAPNKNLWLEQELYDAKNALVKRLTASAPKRFGIRYIPTKWEMKNVQRHTITRMEIQDAQTDRPVKPEFFSDENLRSDALLE